MNFSLFFLIFLSPSSLSYYTNTFHYLFLYQNLVSLLILSPESSNLTQISLHSQTHIYLTFFIVCILWLTDVNAAPIILTLIFSLLYNFLTLKRWDLDFALNKLSIERWLDVCDFTYVIMLHKIVSPILMKNWLFLDDLEEASGLLEKAHLTRNWGKPPLTTSKKQAWRN